MTRNALLAVALFVLVGARRAHADDAAFPASDPTVIVHALIGGSLGEGGTPITGFASVETAAAHPLWLHVRARVMSRYQKLDLLAGYVIHGDDSQPDKFVPSAAHDPLENRAPTSADREYVVIVAGGRGTASFDSVQPGDTAKSTAYYGTVLAGIQLHADSLAGAHKSVELYGAFRTSSAGFVAAAHASFDAVPWLAVGTEISYSKLTNMSNDFYATLEVGVSWGN